MSAVGQNTSTEVELWGSLRYHTIQCSLRQAD